MANLEIVCGGLKMRRPIGVASIAAPIKVAHKGERQAEILMRYVDQGAGWVYLPLTDTREKRNELHRKTAGKWGKVTSKGYAPFAEGLFIICNGERFIHTKEETEDLMNALTRKNIPKEVPIIANFCGNGIDVETWVKQAIFHEELGVSGIELNMSCPGPATDICDNSRQKNTSCPAEIAGMAGIGLDPLIGDTIGQLGPILKAVKEAVKIPVGVKPSAELGFPRCVMAFKEIQDNGGDWICSINTPISVPPPDIYNEGKPPYQVCNVNTWAGMIGPWNRFLAFKHLAACAMFVPGIDFKTVGGYVNPEHAIQAFMLGAKTVELSSAIFWKGYREIGRFIKFLEKFMNEYGYKNMDELRGKALQYCGQVDESVDFGDGRYVAAIDQGKCNLCGTCYHGFCDVIRWNPDKELPVVNEDECGACELCTLICPENAINLVEKA